MKRYIFTFLFVLAVAAANAQFYSARTNIIGLATANINAEFSMTLNRKTSLHFPIQYNPFVFGKENRQWRNFYFSPGIRYWWRESYTGSFVGAHIVAARYSIGKVIDDYRYLGNAYGLGASIGKAYAIGKKWNIEWEVGLAGIYTNYDKYICKECGRHLGREKKFFVLPSKLALNLVYLF